MMTLRIIPIELNKILYRLIEWCYLVELSSLIPYEEHKNPITRTYIDVEGQYIDKEDEKLIFNLKSAES